MSSNRSEAFFAPCPRGLEAHLAAELTALGAQGAVAAAGGVAFTGGWEACYCANLWSRLASRVLWRVAEFDYSKEEDIHAAARAVAWPTLFAVERSLRVYVTAHRSPVKSLEFVTLRTKDAVCDRFRDEIGSRPNVDKAQPDVRVHVYLEEKRGSLYLDTSGEPLFKRGGRVDAVEAPLRENLAAGILMLAGWTPGTALLDPMCGGGTLLIEAAAIELERAPGAGRAFGFEKLTGFDADLWRRLGDDARARRKPARPLPIFGSDSDSRALAVARRNLAAAGIERAVTLAQVDVLARAAPAATGILVANPPYGERIGEIDDLAAFYPKLGNALKKNFPGWTCHLFTADLRLPKLIRLQPSRRVPLFNGALECRLYEFRIVAGSHRAA